MKIKKSPVSGVLIVGLRRSGTTIFWDTYRKDISTLCFDEPFHPALWKGQLSNSKGTWFELAQVWRNYGSPPVNGVLPISPTEELDPTISQQQCQYLRLLFEQNDKVVIDTVRMWNKLPALLTTMPGLQVVHIVRSPISWVTAQLVPPDYVSKRRKVANVYRRTAFFLRQKGYNNWHYEKIVDDALRRNHAIWRYVDLDASEIIEYPGYVKLLAFWWAVTKFTHNSLQNCQGIRHLTTTLEDFSRNPKDVMDKAYFQAGWYGFYEDLSHVNNVRSGWKNQSEKWASAFSMLRIPLEFRFPQNFDQITLTNELSN